MKDMHEELTSMLEDLMEVMSRCSGTREKTRCDELAETNGFVLIPAKEYLLMHNTIEAATAFILKDYNTEEHRDYLKKKWNDIRKKHEAESKTNEGKKN
jgi:hypothetical protein